MYLCYIYAKMGYTVVVVVVVVVVVAVVVVVGDDDAADSVSTKNQLI